MKNKMKFACLLACLLGNTTDGWASLVWNEEIVVSITDKKGTKYSLIRSTNFTKGVASLVYALEPENKPNERLQVYLGAQGSGVDASDSFCARKGINKLEVSYINDRFVVKDLNHDGWNDIGLRIMAVECKMNGKSLRLEKNLYATEHGFKIEEIVKDYSGKPIKK